MPRILSVLIYKPFTCPLAMHQQDLESTSQEYLWPSHVGSNTELEREGERERKKARVSECARESKRVQSKESRGCPTGKKESGNNETDHPVFITNKKIHSISRPFPSTILPTRSYSLLTVELFE